MHSITSTLPNSRKYLLALGAVAVLSIGALSLSALFVHAAVGPVVNTVTTNSSNAVVTSAIIGTNITAGAKVASSTNSTAPTGTVTFSTFANQSCTGTPTVQSGVALVNGMASSSAVAMTNAGLSYIVNYNGDASNLPSVSNCTVVTPTSAAVTVTNALSASTVNAGSSVTSHATLSGATANATGTVMYKVFTNNTCTVATTSPAAVTVTNGNVPTSNAITFNQVGNYYWLAVYSGDNANTAATSSCGLLTVNAVNTPVPPVVIASSTISGTVFNDANRNKVQDNGEGGIAGILIWLHLGKHKYDSPIVATTTTDSLGHYVFSNIKSGTYFVEQQLAKGFKQKSEDKKVKLTASKTSAIVNFADVSASSTKKHIENDNQNDNENDNGNHFGQNKDHND